jgi:hypothetical protein
MLIRHAEKPIPDGADGVTCDGRPADSESLSQVGWLRAKALVDFFVAPTAEDIEKPDFVFAAAPEVGSKRPKQTVTPLAKRLWPPAGLNLDFNAVHPKEDVGGLVDSVMAVDGVALVCWEHTLIPPLVAKLPKPPAVPQHWPGHRFDVVWVLTAIAGGWRFDQTPQKLLPGDKNKIIQDNDLADEP